MVVQDALRLSQAETERMLARSYHTWLSCTAKTNPQDGLQPDCVLLRNVLGRVPAFLANGFSKDCGSPRFKLRHSESTSNDSALYFNGCSTWCISEGGCSLKEKIMHHQLLLGLQSSTRCCFADESPFSDWPGVQGEQESPEGGNCLAIISFACAYILSALWVEMQQSKGTGPAPAKKCDQIYYLCSQAKWVRDGDEDLPDDLAVDLGDIDDDAARWWTAPLANGEGWRATITRDSKVYRSPWSISIAATRRFKLRRTAQYQKSYSETAMPPSSEQALPFLSDFCVLHNTRSQSSAALAVTLTFPFLSNMNATLSLPKLNSYPIASKTMSLALPPTPIYPSMPPFSPTRLETEIVFEEEFARISINSDDVVSEVRKDRELKSELLSELATRSIFEWLRVTGYPRCEQDIYRHSWIDLDLEELDEEELDDGISAGRNGFQDATDIHRWMDSALSQQKIILQTSKRTCDHKPPVYGTKWSSRYRKILMMHKALFSEYVGIKVSDLDHS
ncbi:hypothetical protein SS1G_03536 [Sclerotinia sclerotiorum 1980 UF-70]|uniref:Uncharacterized protein n=1 Tax=Sclerotinia sclerotiorum (strain ATCC 18683 / 1980 / Ss-1) TaxID=665079 RepID=A7EDZ6_SCLS1|nr:hypothetical protein SS1G_03536 [Sclerotinia sclerotiorum 1980 UF-70]EDO01062.1 hypothetical protein SS1G_03536 [Sclerotinia sclerotiorum 1980 UF-70]